MDGKGIFTFAPNHKKCKEYNGEYMDDRKHGTGKLTYIDGGFYEGQFKNGRLHGEGVMTDKNGNKEQGEWKKGKKV